MSSSSPSPLAVADSKSMFISTSPIVNLVLRVTASFFLFASVIIITANIFTIAGYYDTVKIHFNEIIADRYILFTVVVGSAYMLLQSAFAIYHATMGKRINLGLDHFDFYPNKVISFTMAIGTAIAFGGTSDWKIQLVSLCLHLFSYFIDIVIVTAAKRD